MKPRTDEIGVVLEQFDIEHVIEHAQYAKEYGATSTINASGYDLGRLIGRQTVQISESEFRTLTDLVFDAAWTYRRKREDTMLKSVEVMLHPLKSAEQKETRMRYLAGRIEELWLKETEADVLKESLHVNYMESRALLTADQ